MKDIEKDNGDSDPNSDASDLIAKNDEALQRVNEATSELWRLLHDLNTDAFPENGSSGAIGSESKTPLEKRNDNDNVSDLTSSVTPPVPSLNATEVRSPRSRQHSSQSPTVNGGLSDYNRDIEAELELVEPQPSRLSVIFQRRRGYHRTYRAVDTLYLEDLRRIYRAIDSTLEEEKTDRQETIRSIEETRERTRQIRQRNGEESIEEPLPEIFTRPLIGLSNEEYKFRDLDQVEKLPRLGFRQFKFDSKYPGIDVDIRPGQVEVDTYSDDERYNEALRRIHTVIGHRQNKAFVIVHNRYIGIIGWILWIFASTIYAYLLRGNFGNPWTWFFIGTVAFGWAMRIASWLLFSRRKYSVVPKLEVNVHRGFWDRHAALIGIIASLFGALATVGAWWFPR